LGPVKYRPDKRGQMESPNVRQDIFQTKQKTRKGWQKEKSNRGSASWVGPTSEVQSRPNTTSKAKKKFTKRVVWETLQRRRKIKKRSKERKSRMGHSWRGKSKQYTNPPKKGGYPRKKKKPIGTGKNEDTLRQSVKRRRAKKRKQVANPCSKKRRERETKRGLEKKTLRKVQRGGVLGGTGFLGPEETDGQSRQQEEARSGKYKVNGAGTRNPRKKKKSP